MSEKTNEILSKKSLIIIEIAWFLIFAIGLILALYFNEAFYSSSSAVRAVFKIITYLGEDIILIVMVAIFYIIYDKKFAKNLAFSLMASHYLNGIIKDTIKDPRPATNIDPTAEHGFTETTYGFPSGHSQNAVATWGYLAYELKGQSKLKPFLPSLICSIVIFLIVVSRIIIGVHDMNDIVGGILIGIVFLVAFIYFVPIITEKIKPLSLLLKISLSIVVSIVLLLVGIFLFPYMGYGNFVTSAIPYDDVGPYAQVSGAILGLSIGYLLEEEYVKYDPSAIDNKQKLINLVIGMVILLVVFYLLEFILKINVITRFIRFALVAFILTFVVPLLFTKINKK